MMLSMSAEREAELLQRPGEELLRGPQQQLAELGQRARHRLLHLLDLLVDRLDGGRLLVLELVSAAPPPSSR